MARIAFLKILAPKGVVPDVEGIHAYLKANDDNLKCFEEVRPFEEFAPNGYEHCLVVWRYNRSDRVSDEEILEVAGEDGNVLYLWRCARCKEVARKPEYLKSPDESGYFGCECPETVFLGMTMF